MSRGAPSGDRARGGVEAGADERWLSNCDPQDNLLNTRLLQLSRPLATVAAVAAAAALVLWQVRGNFPAYFVFLVAGALLPAMFLYRSIGRLMNWPAFAVTTLYVIVTSLIWEVTLAIPDPLRGGASIFRNPKPP